MANSKTASLYCSIAFQNNLFSIYDKNITSMCVSDEQTLSNQTNNKKWITMMFVKEPTVSQLKKETI